MCSLFVQLRPKRSNERDLMSGTFSNAIPIVGCASVLGAVIQKSATEKQRY